MLQHTASTGHGHSERGAGGGGGGSGHLSLRGVPTERWKPVDGPYCVIKTMHRTVGTPSLSDLRLSMG